MSGPKTNEGATKVGERAGTRAVARYCRLSASKARAVLDLIRGLDVKEAADVLHFTERGAARVISKCLASAIANAQNNDGQDPDELYVSACFADEGPTLKRFRPRARGRATRIRKRTCHITIIVSRMSEEQLEQRRRREAARPQPGRRGRTGATAASSRRERVARSRQAAAARGAAPAPATEEEPTADELEAAEAGELDEAGVTGELDEDLADDELIETDSDDLEDAEPSDETEEHERDEDVTEDEARDTEEDA